MNADPMDPCRERGDIDGGGSFDPGGVGGGRGRRLLLEAAVLAALADHQSTHGYDLRRILADLTGGFTQGDSGNIYRLLRRLEQEGLVTSTWAEGDFGPQRREYQLTRQGCDHLLSWRKHLEIRERAFRAVIDAINRPIPATPTGASQPTRSSTPLGNPPI